MVAYSDIYFLVSTFFLYIAVAAQMSASIPPRPPVLPPGLGMFILSFLSSLLFVIK